MKWSKIKIKERKERKQNKNKNTKTKTKKSNFIHTKQVGKWLFATWDEYNYSSQFATKQISLSYKPSPGHNRKPLPWPWKCKYKNQIVNRQCMSTVPILYTKFAHSNPVFKVNTWIYLRLCFTCLHPPALQEAIPFSMI